MVQACLFVLMALAVAGLGEACMHSPSGGAARTPPPGCYEDYVWIVFVNDDDGLDVINLIRGVLRPLGIRPISEGSSAGQDVGVLNRDALPAVVAIMGAPELKGRGVIIKKRYRDLIEELRKLPDNRSFYLPNQRVEAMTRSADTLLFQSTAQGALLVMPHPYRSASMIQNAWRTLKTSLWPEARASSQAAHD